MPLDTHQERVKKTVAANPNTRVGRLALIKLNRERLRRVAKTKGIERKRRRLGTLSPIQFFGKDTKDPVKLAAAALEAVSEENIMFGFKDPIKRKIKAGVLARLKKKIMSMEKK